ncbi:hypothetical protein HGRIS_001742 [Hohenbuehelia grisea]|uniref:NAD(P)-binding protein n=1 Tax=Hohenbuehelia grisea TaxID=104357 RepID=A0ABR3JIC9_9AGAR
MGVLGDLIDHLFVGKPKWTVEQIPDLSEKVIIVTGGNTGIGKETIRALLNRNAKVYMASRTEERARAAIADLKADTGKEALFLHLDLANLASVRKAAAEFLSQERELHVLFNNAGVMWPSVSLVTDDGYDLQFGTNVIGHFLFTQLLMPVLLSTAQASPDRQARIITTSSIGGYLGHLDYDTFKDSAKRRSCFRHTLYAQSKYGNVVVAREIARRYADKGIVSISLHPGTINSELPRYMPGYSVLGKLAPLLLHDSAHGALTQLFVGTTPDAAEYNGKYFVPWARLGNPHPTTQDPEVAQRLWAWLEKEVSSK